MAAIAWWGIPIGATLIAVLWTSWVGRPRGPESVHDTVRSYERFKAALSATPPPPPPPSSHTTPRPRARGVRWLRIRRSA